MNIELIGSCVSYVDVVNIDTMHDDIGTINDIVDNSVRSMINCGVPPENVCVDVDYDEPIKNGNVFSITVRGSRKATIEELKSWTSPEFPNEFNCRRDLFYHFVRFFQRDSNKIKLCMSNNAKELYEEICNEEDVEP